MDLLKIIEELSVGETLDFKELILTIFGGDIDVESIYKQIKDTSI